MAKWIWGVFAVVAAGVGGMIGSRLISTCEATVDIQKVMEADAFAQEAGVRAPAPSVDSLNEGEADEADALPIDGKSVAPAAIPLLKADAQSARVTLPCADSHCQHLWSGLQVTGRDHARTADPTIPNEQDCIMTKMKAGPYFGGGSPPWMCLRHYWDIVSTDIRVKGMWRDCPVLAKLWEMPCQEDQALCSRRIYIDIGANVGACLLLMLARPDVERAIAYEPSLANLFYLTSTLLLNPLLAQKVNLYTAALGSTAGMHAIYAEPNNAGNTILDSASGYSKIGDVATVTLDDSLMSLSPLPYIHVAKLDAQGYEVKILRGAKRVLSAGLVAVWKFELSRRHLLAQNTKASEYLNCFLEANYYIAREATLGGKYQPLNAAQLHQYGCTSSLSEIELLAVKAHPGDLVPSPLRC
mmetsp:Transcript_69365/g.166313  ORF Transcript_69365/g.166313 Transcript_69365/m.166313 type:complete len:413 (+) Transcript_69365:151-1389(+)